MNKTKILVALVLLPAFIWLIGWAPFWLLLVVLVLLGGGLGGWESARLVFGPGDAPLRTLATLLSIAGCLAASTGDDQWMVIAVVGSLLLSLLIATLLSADLTKAAGTAAKLMLVMLYPGLLTGFVAALKSYETIFGGTKLLMVLFALVWVNDAGAFFAGSALGKRKLAPRISPNKTWEGTIGGFAASVLLGLIIAALSRFTAGQGLLLGVVFGVLGPLGDLAESALKRGAGVKDSGALLPGHGGVLDRLDSVIVCAPLLYYFVLTTHYAELLNKFGVTP